jgi:hypothetical protein
MEGQKDGGTEGQMDRWTEGQTDGQKDRGTEGRGFNVCVAPSPQNGVLDLRGTESERRYRWGQRTE